MKHKSMQLKDTCEESGTEVIPVAVPCAHILKNSVIDTGNKIHIET